MKSICLRGVKQNNLKSIDVTIPLGSFTTICGPSGSGKSSLAFETLYAEGQRRYIESLSNYSKQFLNKAPKPDVESIENIPPSISIEQKNGVKSSRSTVGTTTEVIDYLRLLYEKMGIAHCPDHQLPLEKDSPVGAAQKIISLFSEKRGYILAPVFANAKRLGGKKLLAQLIGDGFIRILVPQRTRRVKKETTPYFKEKMGKVLELESRSSLPRGDFYIVVDRLGFNDQSRLVDSILQAFKTSIKYNKEFHYAQAKVITTDGWAMRLDERYSCSICEYNFPEINSRLFSFNNPIGACEECNGFGNILTVDPQKVIPNPRLNLYDDAIKPFSMPSAHRDKRSLMSYCKSHKIDIHLPWEELPRKERNALWKGCKEFYGVMGFFKKLEKKEIQNACENFSGSPQKSFSLSCL